MVPDDKKITNHDVQEMIDLEEADNCQKIVLPLLCFPESRNSDAKIVYDFGTDKIISIHLNYWDDDRNMLVKKGATIEDVVDVVNNQHDYLYRCSNFDCNRLCTVGKKRRAMKHEKKLLKLCGTCRNNRQLVKTDDVCVVCQEPLYNHNNSVFLHNCKKHVLHKVCFQKLTKMGKPCPLCGLKPQ